MVMRMEEVAENDVTHFSPLNDLIEGLDGQYREKLETLSFLTLGIQGDLFIHPLIYDHPVTNKPTLYFHPRTDFIPGMVINADFNDFTCDGIIS